MNTLLNPRAIVILVLSTWCQPMVHAEYYQWIDQDGNVHYSDHIPVNDKDYEQRVIDTEGQTIGIREGKKTPEELEAERREQALREEQQRNKEIQQAHDRALLATFQSIHDLETARDERLTLIDQSMALANNTLKKHQNQLVELNQKRAALEAADKPIPGWIETNAEKLQEQININKKYLRDKRLERIKIADKFNRDIERFIQLTVDRSISN